MKPERVDYLGCHLANGPMLRLNQHVGLTIPRLTPGQQFANSGQGIRGLQQRPVIVMAHP